MAPLTLRLPEAKISVSDEAKLPSKAKEDQEIPPKPTMVLEISDAADFTKMVENECYSNFTVDIAGGWVKIITDSYSPKAKISNFLKRRKFQFCT